MKRQKRILNYFNKDLTIELFNTLDLGVHILDGQGFTVLYNNKCEEIEGIENTWIVGSDMKILVRDGIYSESVGLKAIEKRRTVSMAQRVNDRYIYSTAVPIFEGKELINVVISVVDMTSMEDLKEKLIEVEGINTKIKRELEIFKKLDSQNRLFISKSKAMEDIKLLAIRISGVDSNILIEGESGVGKGVLSKFIHHNSDRHEGPFIKIDCGSLAPSLIESELFGYEEGSFTGAKKEGKIGLIELSQGGTLFLDEIGELPLNLQVKLLAVIQEKKLQRVGGNKLIDIDTRIIAATNRDLSKMVDDNKFRMDLYYRLKVIYIKIPPLRERKEDILPLINLFLERLNNKYNFEKIIASKAMKTLLNYDWPGNVREIENEIERLIVTTSSDVVKNEDVLDGTIGESIIGKIETQRKFKDNVLDYEKNLLEDYLYKSRDIHELSDRTGLEKSTLRKKAKRLGIELDFTGNNS
nr:sigma 54-interacting transcriptional regulator [Tissierella sp.]